MRESVFWKRFVRTTESSDLDDLRRDLILIVSVVVLVFVIFIAFQRYLVQGISTTGLKG